MPDYTVSVPNTAQAGIYQLLDERPIFSSLTFRRVDGVLSYDNLLAFAHELRIWYATQVEPYLSHDHRLDQVSFLSLDHSQFNVAGTTEPQLLGGNLSPSLPNNVGFRLEFKTALSGRAYRGWNTVIGLPRVHVLNSRVDAFLAIVLQVAYAELIPLSATNGWEWVVTSTRFAGAPRAMGITTAITTVTYKDLVVDSCRHRLPNRRFS
jgi:hypothetical protein